MMNALWHQGLVASFHQYCQVASDVGDKVGDNDVATLVGYNGQISKNMVNCLQHRNHSRRECSYFLMGLAFEFLTAMIVAPKSYHPNDRMQHLTTLFYASVERYSLICKVFDIFFAQVVVDDSHAYAAAVLTEVDSLFNLTSKRALMASSYLLSIGEKKTLSYLRDPNSRIASDCK